MATIIVPAEYQSDAGKYYDYAINIKYARAIHMQWRWNVRNDGEGPGWIDFWIELKREVGWREGTMFYHPDPTWVVYEPGRVPFHGLKYSTDFLDSPESKEFSRLRAGVRVEPGFQGVMIPKGNELHTVTGQLTIPGPEFSQLAKTFWERRLGKAYGSGYQPAQKFHLTVKLIGLAEPQAAFNGPNATILAEHRYKDLFEVEYA